MTARCADCRRDVPAVTIVERYSETLGLHYAEVCEPCWDASERRWIETYRLDRAPRPFVAGWRNAS